MEGKRDYLCALALACLALSQLTGCCCDNSGADFGADYYGRPIVSNSLEPACFGYHSTCWSRWPEDCPNCPLPTKLPPIEELQPSPPPVAPPSPPTELSPENKQPSAPAEPLPKQDGFDDTPKSTQVPKVRAIPAANRKEGEQKSPRNILPRKSVGRSDGL